MQDVNDAKPTLPPGPADAAALDHGRRLDYDHASRAAAWWATVERAGRIAGFVSDGQTGTYVR